MQIHNVTCLVNPKKDHATTNYMFSANLVNSDSIKNTQPKKQFIKSQMPSHIICA